MARRSPKLTAGKRRRMSKTSFALPSQRAYPMDTIGRARNALARVSQHGTPAQQRTVRRNVTRKWPSLKRSNR